MIIVDSPVKKSDCYNDGRFIKPKGIMIHSVGCPQPSPDVFYKIWNKQDAGACVHAVIGADGRVLQLLPWNKRGWHCGSSGNNTHIGVEMTEPSTIKYTGGSSWVETSDGKNTESHVRATYKYAVELFAYLCEEYNLDPEEDGVVISHAEGYKRGIASNHGDPEHIWGKFGYSLATFRKDIAHAMNKTAEEVEKDAKEELTPIMGSPLVEKSKCIEVMKQHGVADKFLNLVDVYWEEGSAENVRPEVALAQSCLETGWFTFKGDVAESQNNFGGLGATGGGESGNVFDTPAEGIRAQIQHLKAYASEEPLNGVVVDVRFKYVTRGSAKVVEHLSIPNNPNKVGWANDKDYATKILSILNEFQPKQPVISNNSASSLKDLYRVRKSWEDKSSQIGAYEDKSNAINMAKLNSGYSVFDKNGKVVYSNNGSSGSTEDLYRVRKSWDNKASQLGAFKELDNAINLAKKNAGYSVFDENGKSVYDGVDNGSFSSYVVVVTASILNVRAEPTTNSKVITTVKRNDAYTIVEEDNGWGRLKSGRGWINLSYTSRI